MTAGKSNSRSLLWVSGLIALVLAFGAVYLVHHYGETRPVAAQLGIGRTHPATIHGKTVYLTTCEYTLALGTHAIAIVAIGVFIGLLLRSRHAKTAPRA